MADPGSALPSLRASDADRDALAETLRRHAVAGRLTPDEFDERLGAALVARTTTDLEVLTADLPALEPGETSARIARPDEEPREEVKRHLLQRGGGVLAVDLICVVIWLVAGASGSFWPVWVIVGTGMGLVGTAWRGLGPGGDPEGELERIAERRERERHAHRHGHHHGRGPLGRGGP